MGLATQEAKLEKPLLGLKAFPRREQESFGCEVGRCGCSMLGMMVEGGGKSHTGLG